MRKAQVQAFPLGTIVFIVVLIGSVFPTLAHAVDLTINFAGTGNGRVQGSDVPGTGPINIFRTATIPYNLTDPPSSVVLTAVPTTLGQGQSTFGGWSGCASSSGTQCTVVLDGSKTVTVTFNPVPSTVALTVNFGGSGNGRVEGSDVPGTGTINLFGSNTVNYNLLNPPATVTLTAVPTTLGASQSSFGGWTGCASASGTLCTVVLDASKTVTVIFNPVVKHTLTVTKTGSGRGTVTSNPGGISCGNDCTEAYNQGTNVTLTAAAFSGSRFAGWSGGAGNCAGAINSCSVPMTAARTVTATFSLTTQNQPPSVNAGPSQTITLPNTATLSGSVSDDGLPSTPGRVTSTWSKISGPGTVIYANASSPSTTATINQAGTYVLRLTATDGALSSSSDLTLTVRSASSSRKLPNDLNADGTADLLWRSNISGVVVAWLMNDAAIASTGELGGVGPEWKIVGMGDLNGDNHADIIWRNTSDGVVAIWLMNGLTVTSVEFPGSADLGYVIKGIGDVDGNGTADIVWRDTATGAVALWLLNGASIAVDGFPGNVGLEWEIAGVGDVNADNRADVIWRNKTNGVVAIWLMNGLMVSSVGFPGSAALSYIIKQVGDMDGNGTADIVWQDTLTGAVAVWLMNGTTVAFAGFPGGVPPEWQISGMGDVNSDGQSDLIWQNKTSGEVALWLMNGKDLLRAEFPSGTTTDWEIQ